MENGFLNGLKCILRDKDFNERGSQSPLHTLPTSCALGSSLWLSVPPFVNNHSGSSPFCTYISLYLVYGDVLFVFVFVALRPMSTAMVIAGRSVHLTTLFFLGRLEQAVNQ